MTRNSYWLFVLVVCLLTLPLHIAEANTDLKSSLAAPSTSLKVYNNSSKNICYLYVAPVGAVNWGADTLGIYTLKPNQNYTVTLREGYYHLRADDCAGYAVGISYNNYLAGSMEWKITDPVTELEVINRTSQPICNLYISSTTSSSWGNDWIPRQQAIYPGYSYTVRLVQGDYDLLAENCSGQELLTSNNNRLVGSMYWAVTLPPPSGGGNGGNTNSSGYGNQTGEQIYERIRNGETIDFSLLNCSQLQYLAQKYQSIADSASRASNAGNSPAAAGSALTAVQAYNRLAAVRMAMGDKGCPMR